MEKQTKKRILVTGNRGFIGWNFTQYLFSKSSEVEFVLGVDKISEVSIKDPIWPVLPYKFVKGHTSNTELMRFLLEEYSITDCVDFAASSHVDESIKNPDIFFEDNIRGTYGLVKAALDYQKNVNNNFRYLKTSTDEVFGTLNINDEPFTEQSQYRPSNPYSSSKAAGDHIVYSFYKTFGLNAIITHSCNNYGPLQDVTKMTSKTIVNAIQGKDVIIYGKGEEMRQWIFIDDSCSAIWFVLNNGKCGENYNIGDIEELKNIELVHMILNILKTKYKIDAFNQIKFVENRLSHDFRYRLDFGKLVSLGWQPKYSFNEGLEKTVEWYYNRYNKKQ